MNLLREKGDHGDNAAMVEARRAFLSRGFYAPLRDTLAQAVQERLSCGILLDSGCGEGYYTEALVGERRQVFGIDISAKAAAKAAKRPGVAGVAVASAYRLPVADASCDGVVSVFAPLVPEEFHRVLRPDGFFFHVIPAERHLWELKCAIYDAPYENRPLFEAPPGFILTELLPVETVMSLDREAIASLLLMTPYFYRTDRAGHARADALEHLNATASFYVLVCRPQ